MPSPARGIVRTARATALVLAACSLSVTTLGAAAWAEDEGSFDHPHPLGKASLVVSSATGGFTVCYSGSVWAAGRVAGLWEVAVGGTSVAVPVVVTASGTTISGCTFASKSGLPGGEIVATFTYVGAGTTIGTSVVAGSVGSASWAPIVGDAPVSVDLNQ
ncbi:MAG TPA: hypothetical protein VF519_02175 [Mycobacteriales bacterium]|jgi:hypothetical protein